MPLLDFIRNHPLLNNLHHVRPKPPLISTKKGEVHVSLLNEAPVFDGILKEGVEICQYFLSGAILTERIGALEGINDFFGISAPDFSSDGIQRSKVLIKVSFRDAELLTEGVNADGFDFTLYGELLVKLNDASFQRSLFGLSGHIGAKVEKVLRSLGGVLDSGGRGYEDRLGAFGWNSPAPSRLQYRGGGGV